MPSMKPQDLAAVVRARMEARGLNAVTLAEKAGISRQTVANFVRHGKTMTSTHLAAVLAALDLIVIAKEAK